MENAENVKGFCYVLFFRVFFALEENEQKNRKEQKIIKCKAKLYETYELLSKRILHKLYAPREEQQRKIGKEYEGREMEKNEGINK